MALFFLLILWALQSKKEAQQQALFAGMAKETAHQLGTPLTSAMGWLAILEEKVGKSSEVMRELNRDVDRLSMVSARFSQMVDGKGTITVKVGDHPTGGARITISDTGRGIPAGVGNKVFEPGFTTKKRGWGMGLALVRRIVNQYHKGRITIESTSSHGTTFLLVLPLADSIL